MNLELRTNEARFNDVKSTEYPFALSLPMVERPETQLVSEYTAKYVPNVICGLLDQYGGEQYTAEEVQRMKISAMEDAYSGKMPGLHWKFHVCIGRKVR